MRSQRYSKVKTSRVKTSFCAVMFSSSVMIAGLIAAAPAHAQTSNASGSQAISAVQQSAAGPIYALSSQDQQFLMKAGPGNLAEIQMGKLAMQKGGTAAVREFGRWMVTDHTMAYRELRIIAQRMYPNAANPEPTSAQAMQYKKLEALSGARFDRVYLAANEKAHMKTIAAFQQEANQGQNLLIKGYAINLLPGLQQHLEEIHALNSSR